MATSVLGGGKNDTQTKRKRGLFDIGDFGSHGGGMFVLLRMCVNLLHQHCSVKVDIFETLRIVDLL